MQKIKTALTIAGSDSSGGAGIQADLKTFSAFNVYGMSVITALTAQNTRGVSNVLNVPSAFVEEQLNAVLTDIVPDAIKIGMLVNADIIKIIANSLAKFNAKNIVVDTILLSTSGYPFLDENAKEVLLKELLPLATLITPNINEAKFLNGIEIKDKLSAEKSAKVFRQMGLKNVLIKGGHFLENADDLLMLDEEFVWLNGERLNSNSTHGTGCTLSSSIASNLALGKSLRESVEISKTYVYKAIKSGFDLGGGIGPLNHFVK